MSGIIIANNKLVFLAQRNCKPSRLGHYDWCYKHQQGSVNKKRNQSQSRLERGGGMHEYKEALDHSSGAKRVEWAYWKDGVFVYTACHHH